jgi:hypothetical protein
VSAVAAPRLKLLTFADLERGVWGFAWIGDDAAFAAGPSDAATALQSPRLQGAGADEDWTLTGGNSRLVFSPLTEPVPGDDPQGYEQLSRARGTLVSGSVEHELDCLARRGVRPLPRADELGSIRDFSAFFEPDRGAVLTSARGRRAKGHEDDRITAVLFEGEATRAVAEPRLSTTYDAAGEPLRAGLELWLEEAEDGEEVYPRRVTGESLGQGTSSQVDEFALHAYPFRCVGAGAEGTGVYLLARAT